MKKLIHSLTAFVLLLFMVSFNGCDELQSLPLNIPFGDTFTSTTNSNNTFDDASFCLNGSKEWNENVDKIKSAEFISAGFWIEPGTTSGLTGNVRVTLRQNGPNGTLLFDITIPNIVAANLVNGTTINLNSTQIQAINSYLETFKNTFDNNLCFYATIEVLNINGQGPPFTVNGRFEIIIQADVEF